MASLRVLSLTGDEVISLSETEFRGQMELRGLTVKMLKSIISTRRGGRDPSLFTLLMGSTVLEDEQLLQDVVCERENRPLNIQLVESMSIIRAIQGHWKQMDGDYDFTINGYILQPDDSGSREALGAMWEVGPDTVALSNDSETYHGQLHGGTLVWKLVITKDGKTPERPIEFILQRYAECTAQDISGCTSTEEPQDMSGCTGILDSIGFWACDDNGLGGKRRRAERLQLGRDHAEDKRCIVCKGSDTSLQADCPLCKVLKGCSACAGSF
jgi:hypothetical protein